jgi:tRNA pseudouridine38-40 synthase
LPNIRLVLEYDGAAFYGWQRQKELRTVQGELEGTLCRILQENVSLTGAGRTDAGCHASCQVANFKSGSLMPLERMAHAINGLMRGEVVVRHIDAVPDGFNARFSAVSRTYGYLIATRPTALMRGRTWAVRKPLDTGSMNEACSALLGERDFSGFCKRNERTERNPVCRVMKAEWAPWELGVRLEITADRFMQGMVRMIVGTAVRIGTGSVRPVYVKQILEGVEGHRAGPAAPARGLCLLRVEYGGANALNLGE